MSVSFLRMKYLLSACQAQLKTYLAFEETVTNITILLCTLNVFSKDESYIKTENKPTSIPQ